jgi:hypothetical protein
VLAALAGLAELGRAFSSAHTREARLPALVPLFAETSTFLGGRNWRFRRPEGLWIGVRRFWGEKRSVAGRQKAAGCSRAPCQKSIKIDALSMRFEAVLCVHQPWFATLGCVGEAPIHSSDTAQGQ